MVSVAIYIWKSFSHERNRFETFLVSQYKQVPDYCFENPDSLIRPDRPDLAAYHEYFMTVDPELKRVPLERLAKAYQQTRLIR